MSVVDTHVHLLDISRFHYWWLTGEYKVLSRNFLPEDLKPLLREAGVKGVVVVEATASPPDAWCPR